MTQLLVLAGLAICLFLATPEAQGQENCPLDWHPPPCGPPPKVSPHVKAAAKQNSMLQQELRSYALMFSAVSCPAAALGEKRLQAACASSGVLAGAAQVAKDRQDRIVNDPPVPWPIFEYAYDGRVLSAEELGLAEFLVVWDTEYLRNIVYLVSMVDFLGDFIAVAIDRANSCYSDENGQSHLCYIWQFQRAVDGIQDLGEVFEALAYNFWYHAYYDMTPLIGDGVNPAFVDLLNQMAGGLYTAGQEYQ